MAEDKAKELDGIVRAVTGVGIETLLTAMLAGPEAERDVLVAIGQGIREDVRGDADPDWAAYQQYLTKRTAADPFYTYSGWLHATGRHKAGQL